MPLIRVPQQTERDIEAWEREARADPIVARSARHRAKVAASEQALREFAARGPCYVGVSWGKDSVCVAHLAVALDLDVPLVWFPAGDIENPYCVLVRDAFLQQHPRARYEERAATLDRPWDGISEHDGAQAAFVRESRAFGRRYVSGVRADESGARTLRMRRHGFSSRNTCAPIGWWSCADVFAYLHEHALPLHPAYAMSMGGVIAREYLRVGTLGGRGGAGHGRREWEQRYYGWRLAEIRRAATKEP